MSPTVFREGPFRFFFFHAKKIASISMFSPLMARRSSGSSRRSSGSQLNYQLTDQDLNRALQLVIDHEQEIRDAWHRHFDR